MTEEGKPIASLCSVEIVGTGKTIAGNRQIAEKASLKLDGCRISNFSKDIESREKTSDIAGGGRDIRMIASRSSRLCRTVVPRRCYCCKAVVCPWTFLATPYLVRDGFETRSGFLIRIGEFGVASKEFARI
ncbi:hypothetical protein CIRG_06295 [Coccidioides immitis RMSCC 2394]|uniref:Uncharacterized protein n=1 Tax=Coccidioides immitis RMSCC 2394 TaxID=404692 RepID=A0A0J6YHR8_COCIT|nr:hypothetical protein CIRG_06295 [Coccidioides immitis RMSCC 2394]